MTRTPKTATAVVALIASGLVLGACSSVKDEEVVENVKSHQVVAQDRIDQLMHVKGHQGPANIRHHAKIWLGSTGARSMNGRPLPAALEARDGFSFYAAKPMTLAEIGDEITALTGIPVTLAAELGTIQGGETIDYAGPLSGFLNRVSARRDVSWRHKDGIIHFYGVETRTFQLAAPPIVGDMRADFTSTNGGATNSGGEDSSSASESESGYSATARYEIWEEVDRAIAAMLNGANASYSINRQTGSITVTAAGPDLLRVEEFIKQQNEILDQQIALNLHVLTVDINKEDRSGVNFDMLVSNVGESFALGSLGSLFGNAVTAGAGTLGAIAEGAINSTDDQSATIMFGREQLDADGNATGRQAAAAIIDLTKAYESVSLEDSASTITTSAQPAPLQSSNQRNYIRRSTVTVDEGITTTELEDGTITTGFSMTVTPRITAPGEMMINYNLALSDLVAIPEYSSGGTVVQLPEIDTRAFMQTLRAESGKSIVVAAFEQAEDRSDDGLGLTSKSAGTQRARKATVILLTPVILDDNSALVANRRP